MAQKCVNKGCGKTFTDPEEDCVHHPGPPIFHEGQKGWKCCKPRVLTFDEFLSIPPCTTGKHSTVEVTHKTEDLGSGLKKPKASSGLSSDGHEVHAPTPQQASEAAAAAARSRLPVAEHRPTPPPPPKEKLIEEDEPGVTVSPGTKCKRNACETTYESEETRKSTCTHHPGNALFHEGSKGWTCCKRRVLEFDEFLKIGGCTEGKHMFIGPKKDENAAAEEEVVCKTDFYQTYTHVNVSIFLKKVDKERAKVEFGEQEIDVDLPTADQKRFKAKLPLFGPIVPAECEYAVKGTKVECKLKKADGTAWSTLRSDEESAHIIQIGRPGMA